MPISPVIFEKILQMSALSFSEAEKKELQQDFEQMLNWVSQLQQVDTTGCAPLSTLSPLQTRWAEDTPAPPQSLDNALENAPRHDGLYFQIPTKRAE